MVWVESYMLTYKSVDIFSMTIVLSHYSITKARAGQIELASMTSLSSIISRPILFINWMTPRKSYSGPNIGQIIILLITSKPLKLSISLENPFSFYPFYIFKFFFSLIAFPVNPLFTGKRIIDSS